MSYGKPFSFCNLLKCVIAGGLLFLLHSCSVVPRNYPKNTPFVYDYNIDVIGDLPDEEKTNLKDGLQKQLDDSIAVRTTRRLIFRKVLNRPPVYQATNADKSVLFMRSLLISLGYFYDSTGYTVRYDTVAPDQIRTTVNFVSNPGKLTTFDTIVYNIRHPELQGIALANMKETFLKEGGAFAKGTVAAELDRLVELYRNSGYLKISREELAGLWDTLDVSLLQPSLDPFEQAEILQKLRERRENPKANLEIRLRPGYDSTKLVKYFVGNVNIYPDFSPDTAGLEREVTNVARAMNVIQYKNLFKPKIFPINIYLKHGDLYSQRRYQRTINRLSSLGTWRIINIPQIPRPGQDTVDFNVLLTPADKYVFSANLEATKNQTAVSGNLFGLGLNIGVQNRNFGRAANQSNTNVRFNAELGNKFVQTQQFILSHNIYFPRPIPKFGGWLPERFRDNVRTVFAFNAANTERYKLFNLTTINGSWGYEFQSTNSRRNRTHLGSIKIPNIEYSYLKERDSLTQLITANPALRNIFTDGLVASIIAGYTITGGGDKHQHILSLNAEWSGGPPLTFIRNKFLDSQLYRFIKTDVEYTHLIKRRKSSIALRGFVGVGYEFNSTQNERKRSNLPFFKQYFAGGPNSMRAWSLRRLGQGSVVKEFSGSQGTPDRYGDVQLELNAEYRFPITEIAGVRLEGALFTDIGNIWFLKDEAGTDEEVFKFSKLPKDLAVGIGTGLRVDFNFFLIRLDYAYKAKDPSPSPVNASFQNRWFAYPLFKGTQLQLGINYPFKL